MSTVFYRFRAALDIKQGTGLKCTWTGAIPGFALRGGGGFPRAHHVETVVLLGREKVDGYISVDLDVEKLEGNGGTATYTEIKNYVKEKYGFSVSSLYIAQIKDKAGLQKRKNYNLGSGKTKAVTCPPDKEEAIMDAFKHFKLI